MNVPVPLDLPALLARDEPLHIPDYFTGRLPVGLCLDPHPYAAAHDVAGLLVPGLERRFVHLSRYEEWVDPVLPWHQDRNFAGMLRAVFCIGGTGPLTFVRPSADVDMDRLYRLRDVPPGETCTFTLHVGDAVFSTDRIEDAGWYHGGPVGPRTSLVARYTLPA